MSLGWSPARFDQRFSTSAAPDTGHSMGLLEDPSHGDIPTSTTDICIACCVYTHNMEYVYIVYYCIYIYILDISIYWIYYCIIVCHCMYSIYIYYIYINSRLGWISMDITTHNLEGVQPRDEQQRWMNTATFQSPLLRAHQCKSKSTLWDVSTLGTWYCDHSSIFNQCF